MILILKFIKVNYLIYDVLIKMEYLVMYIDLIVFVLV